MGHSATCASDGPMSEKVSKPDTEPRRAHVTNVPKADLSSSCCRGFDSSTKTVDRPHHQSRTRGKQRRGAIHFAGLAIGHGLGFGIEKLATDHFSQHQHVVAGGVFAQNLALEPSQCLTQQGWAEAARRPFCPSQFIVAGRPAVVLSQV